MSKQHFNENFTKCFIRDLDLGTVKTFYNKDVFADNDEFELAGDDVIDFTESNPFGDP